MPNPTKKTHFGLFFLIFLTSFFLGIIFSFYTAKNYHISLGNTPQNIDIPNLFGEKKDLDMTKFWEVYSIIEENNYSISPVKKQDLIDGAIDGLVSGLGDPFSDYLSPKETQQFQEALAGDFEGIGAVVLKHPLGVEIDRVIKGSPAKKYGIRKGDIVIQADENELKSLNLYEAIEYIKGPAGSSVVLDILRQSEQDMISITVVREKIKIPSVYSEDLEEEIGYISINMFGEDTSKEFHKSIQEFRNKSGIILDLRDNGGGYLTSAVEILSHFVERGEVLVSTKHKESLYNTTYKSTGLSERYQGKVVILINENSASASEITAATLREYNIGLLVGSTTYGKGSVQQPFEMSDGSLVKITIAKWFTPKGENINETGIDPDIKITILDEDYEQNYDRQKEEAQKILKDFINLSSIGLTIDSYISDK